MNSLITAAKALAGYATGFGLVYLACSFAAASFDITTWDAAGRVTAAFMGFSAGILGALATVSHT